ncbi:MAG: DUF5110 domain-containing protein [Prolixibacteraceae bacterium]|nr:DUF5110 domain-containing protein [Prolixibacteraceae bacterium]
MKKINILLVSLLVSLNGISQATLSENAETGRVTIETSGEAISVVAYMPNIICISKEQNQPVASTQAISPEPENTGFEISQNNRHWILKTDSLILIIDKENLHIGFKNHRKQTITSHKGFFSDSVNSGFRISLAAGEKIFGGGEGAIPLNRRGYRLNLNNEPHWGYGWGEENLNFSVPHFISSSNYSVFFNNGAIGYADIGKAEKSILEIATVGGQNQYFFLYNSNQHALQKTFGCLTGTQPMPPRWALGNLMSRFGYQTEKEAREKLDSMLSAGYPVDAIILDLYWFGLGPAGWMMGDLDWYKPNWPAPEKMINDFKKKGVNTILITEPYILESSVNFAEADSLGYFATDSTGKTNIVEDFFFGRAGLIDLFNPDACNWFWKFYQKQVEKGVAGWWGDLGEPEKFHDDLVFKSGKGPAVKNLYGHYWSKMLSDKYDEHYPEKRIFHLNRAGFAGSQRYGSYPWSGDVSRTWGGFKAQLPNMLSMSLSNIPYAHSDLGGFCAEPKNEELYLRWLQFGVFNPVFRPHSEKVPSEPIYYSDSIQRLIKPFFELRYRLLPYNYTLAWRQEQFGETLASPLFLKATLPKMMWGMWDEYFWGDAFLIAPVLEAGQKEKMVFLPNGIWFNFFNENRFLGNSLFQVDIVTENIPVFVKAGSFIPMTSPVVNTAEYDPSRVEIHYYYDRTVMQAAYAMYDDNGETRNAYGKNEFEIINCAFIETGEKLVFTFTNNGNDYAGRPDKREIELIVHNYPEMAFSEEVKIENGIGKAKLELKKNGSSKIEIIKMK